MTPLLSSKEVAALLGVSVTTVDRMARRHRISAHRIEGQWRFSPDDVQLYLAATRREAGPGATQAASTARRGRRSPSTPSAADSGYVPVAFGYERREAR
jgi:excisionase family DNA binding protein